MIRDLNIQATVIRSVDVSDGVLSNEVSSGAYFPVALDGPSASKRSDDASPRSLPPYTLRWRGGIMSPGTFKPGYRLALNRPVGAAPYVNYVVEILTAPHTLPGRNEMQAEVLPVDTLYPIHSDLVNQKGDLLAPAVGLALWTRQEVHQSTGTYEDFDGEADIAVDRLLAQNTAFVIAGEKYRIVSSITDTEGPRVKFTARRSGA